jgi:catechol 2,3-dioxygenase-like lactoylglutathione lyase family enzyme
MSLPIKAIFHHVGITVTNLERSIEWYGKVFGIKPAFSLIVSGSTGEKVLRLPPHVHRAALLPIGAVAIELLEFEPTRNSKDEMRQDDVGYVYICFAVEDLDDVYARLTAEGIDFHTAPMSADEGQVAGSKFCVMRDPDGKTIELVEVGPGMQVAELHKAADAGFDLKNPLIMDG